MSTELPKPLGDWFEELRNGDETMGIGCAIHDAMQDDDEPDYKVTRKLVSHYLSATPKERGAMDYTLVAVCGWTLSSLLERADAPEEAVAAFNTAVTASGGTDF